MATGAPFVPAPFATTTVKPQVATALRSVSYISPSEYAFAPTAVSTQRLVAGSVQPYPDSLASMARVIGRASDWVDLIAFHRPEGCFQSMVRVESDRVRVKPDGSFDLICNVPPVREVVGLAVGPAPSQLQNLVGSVSQDIWLEDKVIHVPVSWSNTPMPQFFNPTDRKNRIYVVWLYVSAWPNVALGAKITAGDATITLQPPLPGGTTLPGIYQGTALTINDGNATETVVPASTPVGLTVALASPAVNNHALPAAPDWTRVSALPQAIEQATISLTSVLIKVRGTRAMVMPTGPGGVPSKQAVAQAGALNDYDNACRLLKKFTTVFLHG